MPNYLKMLKRQQILALLELGWTYCRIEAETGVRRETISRYDRLRRGKPAKVFAGSEANPAKTFPGSDLPPRSAAALYRDTIEEKLGKGLTIQRVWQDLVEEYGYGHSYESLKRHVRKLPRAQRIVGVIHAAPGVAGAQEARNSGEFIGGCRSESRGFGAPLP